MATFTGGEKLRAKLQELVGAVEGPDTVRVGFLEGATYPATPTKTLRARYVKRKSQAPVKGATGPGAKTVPMIAAIQEFGAPKAGIPPRPFFRNMIAAKKSEWGPAMARLLVENDYNVERTLKITGEAIAGQLRQSIIDTNEPPLNPATIARKGFAKPLIDTSHMIHSIDYEVRRGGSR